MNEKDFIEVLNFWFNQENKSLWFRKDSNFDELIKDKFLNLYTKALKEDYKDKTIKENLALIILLDQFPRNMFRGKPQSFASDELALRITKYLLNQGFDGELTEQEKLFVYLPLMHSENLADQELSVKLFSKFSNKQNYNYAVAHKEIIERFGRFSHRNTILGRVSTEEEREFLKQKGSSF